MLGTTEFISLGLIILFMIVKWITNGSAYYLEKHKQDQIRKERKRKNRMKGVYGN